MKEIDEEMTAAIVAMRRAEWLRGVGEFLRKKKFEKAAAKEEMEKNVGSEKIWIGPNYPDRRIFVLGESWYGEFPGDLVTDDGYIRAYLDEKIPSDRMYSRIARACEMDKRQFWEGVMFTNFVQCVGETRQSRPTTEQYKAAEARLERLLEEQAPAGVWIIGIEQSKYSAPVVERAGIPYEVSPHTASFGLTNAKLGEGWKMLINKVTGGTKRKH